jgi:25S rRNA (uracil2634-N3)-methyltransferase
MAKKRKLLHDARGAPKPVTTGPSKKRKSSHGSEHRVSTATGTPSSSRPRQDDQEPVIPFSARDAILLVGEGDLSFAASLVEHLCCEKVTATVPEQDAAALCAKYPHAAANIEKIEAGGCRVVYGVDARKMGPWAGKGKKEPAGRMDRIIFNFPHVGGKSTDVNRQVRYNQELLVGFFRRALLSLAPGGSVIVTLFEGEPYTLWNIRDLGRHAGLQVERSFRFQASAYPGYRHARTLGIVKNKEGEAGAGWRGENRPARSYVFVRKDDLPGEMRTRTRRAAPDDNGSSSGD